MAETEKITVEDVRASFNTDIRIHPTVVYFGRPLANLMTPYFHNSGWTANKMTAVRSYISLVGVVFLAVPIPLLWPISAAVYFLNFALDCVDGNLARLQNDASYFGKFLDGLADGIYPFVAAFCLGIGTWLYYDEPGFLILGSVISIVSISNQMIRNRLSFCREWMVSLSGDLTEEELYKAGGPRNLQDSLAFLTINGYFLAVICLIVPNWGPWLFFGVSLLTQTIPEALWIVSSFVESKALLSRGRISKHAKIPTSGNQ